MLFKSLILSCDESLAEVGRDLCKVNDVAVGAMQTPQFLHVPIVNDGPFGHPGNLGHVVTQGPEKIKDRADEEERCKGTTGITDALEGDPEERRPVPRYSVDEQEGPEAENEEGAVLPGRCFFSSGAGAGTAGGSFPASSFAGPLTGG